MIEGRIEWEWTKRELKAIDKLKKKVDSKDGFYVLETEHWQIRSEVSIEQAAEAGLYMEIFDSAFRRAFNFKTDMTYKGKPILTIFGSRKRYLSIPGIPEWSAGAFTMTKPKKGKEPTLLLFLYTEPKGGMYPPFRQSSLTTIQHEGTHCLLAQLLGDKYQNLPLWLNEGFAGFYEYWDLRVKSSSSGNSKRDIRARKDRLKRSPTRRVLRALVKMQQGKAPSIEDLFKLRSQKEWSRGLKSEDIAMHYALAESFADMMITSRKRRRMLKTVFIRIVKGEQPFSEAEKKSLQTEWHKRLTKRWEVEFY